MALKLNTDRPLTYGEIYKRSIPLGLANMLLVALTFTDLVMIGQHDLMAMAASSIIAQVYLLVFIFGEGLIFGFCPIYGQAFSDKSPMRRVRVIASTCWLMVIYSLLGFLLLSASGWVVGIINPSAHIAIKAEIYIELLGFALLPNLLFILFWEVLAFEKREIVVLYCAVLQFLVNAIANYVLIFGKFGFPSLGLIGAGYATLISSFIGFFALSLAYFLGSPGRVKRLTISFVNNAAELVPIMRPIIRIGFPISLTLIATIGFLSISVFLMAQFGANAVAAHGAVSQVSQVVVVFALGFGEFSAIYFASLDTRTTTEVVTKLRKIIYASLMLVLPVLVLLLIGRPFIAFVFFEQSDPSFSEVSSIMEQLAIISFPLLAINFAMIIMQGTLRGLGITLGPAIIIFISYWVIAVPFQFYLVFWQNTGPIGVWIGLATGFILSVCTVIVLFPKLLQTGGAVDEPFASTGN